MPPGGNRFLQPNPQVAAPREGQLPGLEALSALRTTQLRQQAVAGGLGTFTPAPASPAAVPYAPAAVQEVALSDQWDVGLRDLLNGQAFVRVKQTNGYFGKFVPRGVTLVKNTFSSAVPMAPADNTTVLGGFKIPNNMVLIVTFLEFFANRSAGGTQVAVQPGELLNTLVFGVLDNGHQVGAQGWVLTAPTGGFTFGVFGNAQQTPQNPTQAFQAGPGTALHHTGDAYYVEGAHELVFVASTLASLPYTVTSTAVTLEGVLIDSNSLQARLEVGR